MLTGGPHDSRYAGGASEVPLDRITIRRASAGDAAALDRLAQLDSQRLPGDDFLLAEVGGTLWAAIGARSGAVLADPFRPTAVLTEMLRLRSERLRHERPERGRVRRLLRRRRSCACCPSSA